MAQVSSTNADSSISTINPFLSDPQKPVPADFSSLEALSPFGTNVTPRHEATADKNFPTQAISTTAEQTDGSSGVGGPSNSGTPSSAESKLMGPRVLLSVTELERSGNISAQKVDELRREKQYEAIQAVEERKEVFPELPVPSRVRSASCISPNTSSLLSPQNPFQSEDAPGMGNTFTGGDKFDNFAALYPQRAHTPDQSAVGHHRKVSQSSASDSMSSASDAKDTSDAMLSMKIDGGVASSPNGTPMGGSPMGGSPMRVTGQRRDSRASSVPTNPMDFFDAPPTSNVPPQTSVPTSGLSEASNSSHVALATAGAPTTAASNSTLDSAPTLPAPLPPAFDGPSPSLQEPALPTPQAHLDLDFLASLPPASPSRPHAASFTAGLSSTALIDPEATIPAPSREAPESFARSITLAPQALSAAKPTAATYNGSCHEFVCGECGVMNLLQPGYTMAKCGQCGLLVTLSQLNPANAPPPAPPAKPKSVAFQDMPGWDEQPERSLDADSLFASDAQSAARARSHTAAAAPAPWHGGADGKQTGTKAQRPRIYSEPPLPLHQMQGEIKGWLQKKGGSKGSVIGVESAFQILTTGSGRKNWKSRFFVGNARTQKLHYYKDETDDQPLGMVDLEYCSVRREMHNTKYNCFVVDSKGRGSMLLSASSSEEVKRWITFIESVAIPPSNAIL